MNNQFKVGDLALTLITMPGLDAGSVVEILAGFQAGQAVQGIDGNLYQFGAECWEVRRDGSTDQYLFSTHELMPLRGDFQPERQQSREVTA